MTMVEFSRPRLLVALSSRSLACLSLDPQPHPGRRKSVTDWFRNFRQALWGCPCAEVGTIASCGNNNRCLDIKGLTFVWAWSEGGAP